MAKLNKAQKQFLESVTSEEARVELKKQFLVVNAKKNIKDSKKILRKFFEKGINPTPKKKKFTLDQMEKCFRNARKKDSLGQFEIVNFTEYIKHIENEK